MFWGEGGGVRFQSWACNLGFGVQEFRALGLEEFRDPAGSFELMSMPSGFRVEAKS